MMTNKLGGVLALRENWCLPDERIHWVHSHGTSRYDVPGLKADGTPEDGFGRKVARGVGSATLYVIDLAIDPEGSGSDTPKTPELIVFGPSPHCEAVRHVQRPRPPVAGPAPLLWVLTSRRLACVYERPDPPAPQQRSLLGKAKAFTKGVTDFFTKPPYEPGVPVPTSPIDVFIEIPYGRFTVAGPVRRKIPRAYPKDPPYERIVLPDGSGFDFHTGESSGLPRDRQTTRFTVLA